MHRVSLYRSSGFRLAVAFTSFFLVAAAIAGAAAYSVIKAELEKRHERVLREQMDFFATAFSDGGIADLIETVGAYSNVARNKGSIFLLLDPAGVRLAGNIERIPADLPQKQVDASQLGIDADFTYFIEQRQIGDYLLAIGTSAEDISELEEIVREGGFWAALILLAIAIAGGVALSRRMNSRIARIQTALEQVAGGNFEARIPLGGSGDDIDTLARMMNDTLARLAVSIESIRQISNDISHDLKTPLNRLRIIIEEALDKQADGKPVADELQEATSETNRIIGTFDALLRIAQIESGARKARFARINLAAIVSDVAEFYRTTVEDSGMQLKITEMRSAFIHGDRELLTQLFANLFENALRHCAQGTLITCEVAVSGDAITASVSDNGPGIPTQERENVLRRLYRLESSRTTPGSGLGLSMVKAIADLHDATLALGDNDPGLSITFEFPIA